MASVHLLTNGCGLCHLVVQRANESFCSVVSVFGGTGAPFAHPTFYQSVEAAVASLKRSFYSRVVLEAQHLIGIVQEGHTHVVGFITRSRECAQLPGGHSVKVVEEARFATLSIDGVELGNSTFESFAIAGNHYFCDTYDISRPFPSTESPWNPEPEFCWNLKWRNIFCAAGAPELCISLMQGLYTSFEHQNFVVDYVIRRSSLNPGVRWLGRGFNDKGGPGNEVESELVFWNKTNDDVWTQFWRRGTVPLKWKTECSSLVSVKEVQVVESRFCTATQNYFNRLHEKYGGVTIHCLCLLKQAKNGTEEALFKAYGEAIETMRTKLGMDWVSYEPFDVYHFFKQDDKERQGTVSLLLGELSKFATEAGFNHGSEKQKSIVRINCADSLDRTNMAAWFHALLVTAEWCRRVGLSSVQAPVFSPESPEKSVPTELLQFLVKAFVAGGNIISLMYTNTEAQRAEMIWRYAGQSDPGSSALKISLQRRWNNVMTDPSRHENLLLWTKDKRQFLDRFIVDHLTLTIATPAFPACVCELRGEPDPQECPVSTLTVVLPPGAYLTALWFYQFPTQSTDRLRSVTVNGRKVIEIPNVNTATWARYRADAGTERIVTVEFSPTPFVIGKIAFECTRSGFNLPLGTGRADLDTYGKMVAAALEAKDPSLTMLSEIERTRLSEGITLETSNEMIAKMSANPWYLSPVRYILDTERCCVCHREMPPPPDPDLCEQVDPKYYVSWYFPGLLTTQKPQNYPTQVKVCEKCRLTADAQALQTRELENDVILSEKVPAKFPRGKFTWDEPENLSESPYGCFLSSPKNTTGSVNDLITPQGGSVECQPNAGKFSLALACHAKIERIEIECDGNFTFTLRGKEKRPLTPTSSSNNHFTFNVDTTTKLLQFNVRGDSPVIFKKIAVFGIPCECTDIHVGPRIEFKPMCIEKHLTKRSYKWDETTRIQTFDKSIKAANLVHVIIWVQEPRTAPSSLMFVFKNRDEIVSLCPVRIPVISRKGKIVYNFDIPRDITTVVVMYMDLRRDCTPLPMRIGQVDRELKHFAKSAAGLVSGSSLYQNSAPKTGESTQQAAGMVAQLGSRLRLDFH